MSTFFNELRVNECRDLDVMFTEKLLFARHVIRL